MEKRLLLSLWVVSLAGCGGGTAPDGGAGGTGGGVGGGAGAAGGSGAQTAWQASDYVKATNTAWSASFGAAVSLSGDGQRMAVGSPNEDSGGKGIGAPQNTHTAPISGAVYLYRMQAGHWTPELFIKAADAAPQSSFGSAVSLSADGNTLFVGAPGMVVPVADRVVKLGVVYVFRLAAAGWAQTDRLECPYDQPLPTPTDYDPIQMRLATGCGAVLQSSASGETVVTRWSTEHQFAATATGHTDNPLGGRVVVLDHAAQGWSSALIAGSSATYDCDNLLMPVALSAAGDRFAVGDTCDPSSAVGINGDRTDTQAWGSGAAMMFTRSASGWQLEAWFKASNTGANDAFGTSLALSGDGAILVVGAPKESSFTSTINGDGANDGTPEAGAAYVFRRTGGAWAQTEYVKTPDAHHSYMKGAHFGASVAISRDGSTIVAGAPGEAELFAPGVMASPPTATGFVGSPGGAAYALHCTPACAFDAWITPSAPLPDMGDFGSVVSLTDDGQTLAASCPADPSAATGINGDATNSTLPFSGAVWMFVNP
jgi:hypothetical protein